MLVNLKTRSKINFLGGRGGAVGTKTRRTLREATLSVRMHVAWLGSKVSSPAGCLHVRDSSIWPQVSERDFLPAAGHDLFLPLYDPLVSLLGFDRSRQELISQANIQPDHHILDIGCGTGSFVVQLKRQYPSVHVIGLDPDPKALRRAENKIRRAAGSAQLDHGFADELPYKTEAFDRVFSSFMFHHLEEPEKKKTIKEVRRVLKPRGSFHLLDFTVDHGSHGYLARLVHSHAVMKDNTDERLLGLMNDAGLTNAEKVKGDNMLFGLLQTAYYRASV